MTNKTPKPRAKIKRSKKGLKEECSREWDRMNENKKKSAYLQGRIEEKKKFLSKEWAEMCSLYMEMYSYKYDCKHEIAIAYGKISCIKCRINMTLHPDFKVFDVQDGISRF